MDHITTKDTYQYLQIEEYLTSKFTPSAVAIASRSRDDTELARQ